jgi:7-carboxy-7-deazaguanine synthase
MLSEEQIAQDIRALLPNGSFQIDAARNIHLVITGGEPLLSWQRSYPALLELFPELTHLTFETNGTQPLSLKFVDYLNQRFLTHTEWEENLFDGKKITPEPPKPIHVTFSVSPKLSASGENWNQAIRSEVIESFRNVRNEHTYLKFVVAGEEHIPEVEKAVQELRVDNVYLMPVGGCYEEYMHYQEIVYDLCLKYGYRMSPRYHVNVKGNAWGV